jgi:hypothetical protein
VRAKASFFGWRVMASVQAVQLDGWVSSLRIARKDHRTAGDARPRYHIDEFNPGDDACQSGERRSSGMVHGRMFHVKQ